MVTSNQWKKKVHAIFIKRKCFEQTLHKPLHVYISPRTISISVLRYDPETGDRRQRVPRQCRLLSRSVGMKQTLAHGGSVASRRLCSLCLDIFLWFHIISKGCRAHLTQLSSEHNFQLMSLRCSRSRVIFYVSKYYRPFLRWNTTQERTIILRQWKMMCAALHQVCAGPKR